MTSIIAPVGTNINKDIKDYKTKNNIITTSAATAATLTTAGIATKVATKSEYATDIFKYLGGKVNEFAKYIDSTVKRIKIKPNVELKPGEKVFIHTLLTPKNKFEHIKEVLARKLTTIGNYCAKNPKTVAVGVIALTTAAILYKIGTNHAYNQGVIDTKYDTKGVIV